MKRVYKFVCLEVVCLILVLLLFHQKTFAQEGVMVRTVGELVNAINNGKENDLITIRPGVYELDSTQQLIPKSGMTLKGSGMGLTTLTAASTWNPGLKGLPADEVDETKANTSPYLFKLENISDVRILNMTLTAPILHGAIFAFKCKNLEFFNLEIRDFIWSSILTFDIQGFKIHDCLFSDAGGKVRWMGAAVFSNRTTNGEYYNNKITSSPGNSNQFVGFKARGSNYCRIHHNTIITGFNGFSMEYMHSFNSYMEIDHNNFNGTMSIPSGGKGGDSIPGGYSFWIHHNYFSNSYTLEGPRSYLIVENNYFDFPVEADGGNLYTDHDKHEKAEVYGYIYIRNNQIRNPGRGIFWSKGGADRQTFVLNNHIIANKTITGREDGLFSFIEGSDYSSIFIKNNIVECIDQKRPLLRGDENSTRAVIENNKLTGISDSELYENKQTTTTSGLVEKLNFKCGYRKEYLVDGWSIVKLGEEIR